MLRASTGKQVRRAEHCLSVVGLSTRHSKVLRARLVPGVRPCQEQTLGLQAAHQSPAPTPWSLTCVSQEGCLAVKCSTPGSADKLERGIADALAASGAGPSTSGLV